MYESFRECFDITSAYAGTLYNSSHLTVSMGSFVRVLLNYSCSGNAIRLKLDVSFVFCAGLKTILHAHFPYYNAHPSCSHVLPEAFPRRYLLERRTCYMLCGVYLSIL